MIVVRKMFNKLPRNSKIRKSIVNSRIVRKCQKDDIFVLKGRYLISNVVGSSGDLGSKKKYWESHSNLKFSQCQVENCVNKATVGAHVWMGDLRWSSQVFILPCCQVTRLGTMLNAAGYNPRFLIYYSPAHSNKTILTRRTIT